MEAKLQCPMVSIIIRTFNESKNIDKLLSICFSQKCSHPFEVVIVDSGSTDETCEIALKYPIVLEKIAPEEFTFGRSLNRGMKKSSGDFCIIVSAHCFPENEFWLEEMVKPFLNPKIGMVYGKQRGDSRTKFSEHQIFYKWFPEDSIEETEFTFCNNANSAIRKSLWEKFPFDESLPGLEDMDWAKKIIINGSKLAYSAHANVFHIHEETYQQVFIRYYREALAYKNIYPHQKFNFLNFLALFSLNTVSDLLHALKEGVLFKNIGSIFAFRFQQMWATYKAHNNQDNIASNMQRRLYYPRNAKTLIKTKSSLQEKKNGI